MFFKFEICFRQWLGGAATNGKLFCAPRDANHVLVFDSLTNELAFPAVPSKYDSDNDKGEWSRAVALNGKVYMVPLNADYILIIDAATLEVTVRIRSDNSRESKPRSLSGSPRLSNAL